MNTDLSGIMKYLPLLIPLVLLQLGLQIWALVDLARREATNGPKWLWVVIIILGEFLGAIIYFIVGRKE
jgi:hypothetical protein